MPRSRNTVPEPAKPADPDTDLADIVKDAQADLDRSIQVGGLQNDPLRYIFRALSVFLGVLHKLLLAFFARLDVVRQPVREDVLRDAVAQGISGHAWRFVQAMSVRNILLAAGMLVTALLIGGGVGYWLHGPAELIVGVRAGPEKCDDRPDGSRLCWIPIYERMPTDSR